MFRLAEIEGHRAAEPQRDGIRSRGARAGGAKTRSAEPVVASRSCDCTSLGVRRHGGRRRLGHWRLDAGMQRATWGVGREGGNEREREGGRERVIKGKREIERDENTSRLSLPPRVADLDP